MIKEKVIAAASKYLFVTTLIMLFGLLRSDGMHRGFPLYWMLGRRGGHLLSDKLLLSFAIVLAIVIAADLIAKIIMRTREPELKIIKGSVDYTEKPAVNTVREAEETDNIEVMVSEADEFGEEDDEDVLTDIVLPKKLKQLKAIGTGKTETKTENGKGALVGAVVIGLTVLIAMMPAFFESDEEFDVYEDDVYDYYILEEGDVTLADDDDEEYIESIQDAISSVFSAIMDGRTPGSFTDASEADDMYNMASWEDMEYDDRYTYVSGEEQFAISKFDVTDDDGNDYIMAVLLELGTATYPGEDISEGNYENVATVKGVMLYPDDGEVSAYNISDSDEIKEAEKKLAWRGVSMGQTQINGINILLWSDSMDSLHLEATDEEAP